MNQNNGNNYQLLSTIKLDKKIKLPLDKEIEPSLPPQRGLNLKPYFRIAQRRALLIAVVTSITAAAATYSMSKSPPVYQGNFQLLTEPVTSEGRLSDPNRIARDPNARVDIEVFEQDYPTILTILTGSKMQSAIVNNIRSRYPELKSFSLSNPLTIQRLHQKSETTNEIVETSILEISYQDSDPKAAQAVLDTAAEIYLKYSLEERKNRVTQGVKFIENQLPELQKRVNSFREQLQELQEENNFIDPKVTGEELFTKVRLVTDEQLTTQKELQEQTILYKNLQEQLKLAPDEAIDASTLSEEPNYQKLFAALKDVESQLATESIRFEPDAPQIQVLQEKRQKLESLLNQERQRVLGEDAASTALNSQVLTFQNSTRQTLIQQLITATNQIQVLEARSQALARTRNAFEQQAQRLPYVASRYNEIQRQLEVTTKTLDQLLTQRETLRVEAAQKTVPWELVSAPQIPRDAAGNPIAQPSSSKKLILGVVGGLLLGLGLAVLYEKYRDIFYSIEDLEDATQLPILGKIPFTRRPRASTNLTPILGAFEETAVSSRSASLFLKAFDSLYTNVRFCFGDTPVSSLAVCSATSGDGKSTTALHLAQTAAAMGQQVLLVDANLRSPRLSTWLDLPNLQGFSDLLESNLAPNDLIQQSSLIENLFVLTSGQPLRNSPKQLASTRIQYLKEKFQARFDLVIYDTPNLLDYTDASFLATHTDGILLVVEVGKTKQSAVKQVLDSLKAYGLPILGVVANCVTSSSLTALPQPSSELSLDETEELTRVMHRRS